jgi:hypothetical protein
VLFPGRLEQKFSLAVVGRRGNLQSCNTLTYMHFEHREKPAVTTEERAAKKEKSRWDAEKALGERKKTDDAFRANFERLKAERQAREAPNK